MTNTNGIQYDWWILKINRYRTKREGRAILLISFSSKWYFMLIGSHGWVRLYGDADHGRSNRRRSCLPVLFRRVLKRKAMKRSLKFSLHLPRMAKNNNRPLYLQSTVSQWILCCHFTTTCTFMLPTMQTNSNTFVRSIDNIEWRDWGAEFSKPLVLVQCFHPKMGSVDTTYCIRVGLVMTMVVV